MGDQDQAPDGADIADERLAPFIELSPDTVLDVVAAIRAYDVEAPDLETWERLTAAADYLEKWAKAWGTSA